MLKSNKRCSVCLAIRADHNLTERIYKTKHFLKTEGLSLWEFWEKENAVEKKFSYESLTNHVKKHQYMDADTYSEHHLRKIAKKAERAIVQRRVDAMPVFDTVIGLGMEGLESGELKVTTRDTLMAAKFKKEVQLKEADQQIAIAEMVFHFASGESNLNESRKYDRGLASAQATPGQTGTAGIEDFDPATVLTDHSEERRERSRAFFQRITGDAAASRTDSVS